MRLILAALLLTAKAAAAATVTAILAPARTVEIRSTVNGRVAALDLIDGDRVAAGDPLAQIDGRVQEARVALADVIASAKGVSLRADRVLEEATARRDRIATARTKGAAQEWEVVAAEQAVAVAEADKLVAEDDLRRKRAELALEQATLAEFLIDAPFDATVLEVFVDPGEIVDTGTVLMEVGSIDDLIATAFVPVEWLPGLSRGAPIAASTDLGGRVDATVNAIDPRVDPASRTVRVVLRLDNSDGRYLPGTTLVVEAPSS